MTDLRNLRGRREMIEAILLAVENAEQVMRICSTAAAGAADEALADAFGISDLQAQAVLDMQIRRFTPERAAAVRAELAEVNQRIRDLEGR
ncbi:DNA gyrase subunit A [Microbacterium sp. Mu-80]|uniref:DNA gyrase subunit A n=1 Tax=Microbacterium bandirmense TaxID=3122050 RepID=A0ABU8LBR3_9MICO